ncbi:MAG: hypothetical protein QOE84_884, partial [Actinomycetota bacterium]|nr:hypothetical protein [Actinomycetota bacterium]
MFEDLFAYDVDELGTAAVLTAAATSRALRERLEVLDLLHALRIADLHHEVATTAGRGGERRRVYGGGGCPEIAEFAPVEFGAVMGMSPAAAKAYLDDALGLRHRLPLTFARVLAFDASAWRARKIARACRALPEQAAALVDRRVAAIVNTVTPVRLATIVDAALWEADPAAAQAAAEEHARSRGVWVKRSDDHGTKSIWVRAAAGDVIRFDATIDDIAQALRALGDTDTLDQRRAKAIGIIADPALAHELLEVAHHLAATHTTNTTATASGSTGANDNAAGHSGADDNATGETAAQHHGHGTDDSAADSCGDDHSGDNTPGRDYDIDYDIDGGRGEDDVDGVAGGRGDDHSGDSDTGRGADADAVVGGVAGSSGHSGDNPPGDDVADNGSHGKGGGVAGGTGSGDDHDGDHTPGRGHDVDGREDTTRDDDSGDDRGDDHGDDCGDDSGDDSGLDGSGGVVEDWWLAEEPGLDAEADRDAPHPGSSDLADPLDVPARVLGEPWRGD